MLRISGITLDNFRSYDRFSLDGIGRLTILVGPNASGKTNAIEAIHLLTAGSSFRGASPKELVGREDRSTAISARIEGSGRVLDHGMTIEEGRRRWTVNRKVRTAKELRGSLPSVVFTPDDLQVVKGSDRGRRRELDVLGSQLNANYHQIARDLDKVLQHRNKLLKEGAPPGMMEAVDDVYVVVAEQYSDYREALFDRLMPLQREQHSRISASGHGSGESLEGAYERSWEGDLRQALSDLREEELVRRRTLAGPHLDSIRYTIDGLDATSFASQGQQRSIMLAMKLAEVELMEQMTGIEPVLLLDDVMSELDEARREALVERISGSSQTFVTTANIDYFDGSMLADADVVEL